MSETYIVLVGDLIGSRKLSNRGQVQQSLETLLDQLNEQYRGELVSPFTITLGDEFQAVWRGTQGLWQSLIAIFAGLHSARVRLSLGVGQIATPINRSTALGMDGPAFYCARDGIDELKASGRRLALHGDAKVDDEWIRPLLWSIDAMTTRWKSNRLHILIARMSDVPVQQIADELDISIQAVYRNIRDGDLELVIELFGMVDKLVQSCYLTRKTDS